MFPASTKGGGQCFAAPDVCLTPAPPAPPIPVPYPNNGQVPTVTKHSKKVKISMMPVVLLPSEIPMSMGDQAGVNGGVVSGTFGQKITFKKGSSKVKFEGKAVEYHTAMTGHNGSNPNHPAGMQVAPSQTKVLVGM
jgi:hypothetical protein